MFKTVVIDGNEIPMLANAATPYRYKQIFGADLMKILNGVNSGKEDETLALEAIVQLSYVMNAQAERKDLTRLSFDTFLEWAEQFSPMSVAECADQIIAIYLGNSATSSTSKKKGVKPNAK